jgi:hypothetical protein
LFYRRGMTSIIRPRTVAFTTIAAVLALVLTGCAPESSPTPLIAAPTQNPPPYASGDEALAAAQSTYEEFMAVANQIIVDGGASPDRIDAVAAPAVAQVEKDGFTDFAGRKLTIEGRSTIRAAFLQSYAPQSPEGRNVVTGYFCVDVSAVTVVDELGESLVQPTRPDATAFEVSFDLVETDPPKLVVSAKNVWGDDGIC